MSKTISVLMSVYNEKDSYLRESIESVLRQSFPDFEYIIINDGSTDPRIKETLSRFERQDKRIRVYENAKNRGLTASLDKALEKAKGEFIARIDSDDLADPSRLEKQLDFMRNHPSHALCGSWAHFIDENGRNIGQKTSPIESSEIKKRLLLFNFFTHSSFFFRRDVALAAGGYTPKQRKAQDYDFVLKVSATHPIAILPEFLCSNRIHAKSISSRSKKKQEWYALKARWNAIWKYGYPKTDFLKIIPSAFYFLLVPIFLEKKILDIFYKTNRCSSSENF